VSSYLARKFIVVGTMVGVVAAVQVARGWHRGWGAIGFSALVVAVGILGLRAKS